MWLCQNILSLAQDTEQEIRYASPSSHHVALRAIHADLPIIDPEDMRGHLRELAEMSYR
jgi:hypothetical protein